MYVKYLIAYVAIEATMTNTIVLIQMDKCLRISGVVYLYAQHLPFLHDMVFLRRNLLEQPEGFLLLFL